MSFATANKLIEQFAGLRLLAETTGGQRNRRYRYTPYLALFEDQEATAAGTSAPVQAANT